MTLPRAVVLAIGTEITTGQITDTNSRWLAERLTDLDWDVVLHASVADDMPAILAILDLAAQTASTIILTGGLGPTSDDFTREAVAQWCGLSLDYDLGSWTHIVDLLSPRGITIAESNKQQCFFPHGAKILTNSNGTANAFQLVHNSTSIICLPGPPHEIRGIWNDHLASMLKAHSGHGDAKRLLRWQTLGQSESRIGELVEQAIQGSSLTSGYRPHMPYIEVKIWCREREWEQNQSYLAAVDQALAPWLIGRDDIDLARDLLKSLKELGPILVIDRATKGHIVKRLAEAQSGGEQHQSLSFFVATPEDPGRPATQASQVTLCVDPWDESGQWQSHVHFGNRHIHRTLKMPYKPHASNFERMRNFLCETTLKHWAEVITTEDV